MVCFSHVLVPSFIEQHDLGGRKRTVTRTKPSRLEAVKIPNVFNCDGLFEKIISVRHNKKSKTPKKGINKDLLVLVFFKPKIQCVFFTSNTHPSPSPLETKDQPTSQGTIAARPSAGVVSMSVFFGRSGWSVWIRWFFFWQLIFGPMFSVKWERMDDGGWRMEDGGWRMDDG